MALLYPVTNSGIVINIVCKLNDKLIADWVLYYKLLIVVYM